MVVAMQLLQWVTYIHYSTCYGLPLPRDQSVAILAAASTALKPRHGFHFTPFILL